MSRQATPHIPPRMLSAVQAAEYLGYESTAVLAAIPVKPFPLVTKGQPKYDRHALDQWLDSLSGMKQPTAPQNDEDEAEAALQEWRRGRA